MKLETPTMIGFGTSDRNTFTNACKYTSGAMVGIAFTSTIKGIDTDEIDAVVSKWVE